MGLFKFFRYYSLDAPRPC